jgi:hypothetical protein
MSNNFGNQITHPGIFDYSIRQEGTYYPEKFHLFANGKYLMLLKTQETPQRWCLTWIGSDGKAEFKTGKSEMVLTVIYDEVAKELVGPELDQIRAQLDRSDLPTALRHRLIDRMIKLETADDLAINNIDDKCADTARRIDRLPAEKREAAWMEELAIAQEKLDRVDAEFPENPEDEAAYQELCEEVAPEVREVVRAFNRQNGQEIE